jgi:hypothetical protein
MNVEAIKDKLRAELKVAKEVTSKEVPKIHYIYQALLGVATEVYNSKITRYVDSKNHPQAWVDIVEKYPLEGLDGTPVLVPVTYRYETQRFDAVDTNGIPTNWAILAQAGVSIVWSHVLNWEKLGLKIGQRWKYIMTNGCLYEKAYHQKRNTDKYSLKYRIKYQHLLVPAPASVTPPEPKPEEVTPLNAAAVIAEVWRKMGLEGAAILNDVVDHRLDYDLPDIVEKIRAWKEEYSEMLETAAVLNNIVHGMDSVIAGYELKDVVEAGAENAASALF